MATELPPLEILLRFRATRRRDLLAVALLGLGPLLGTTAWRVWTSDPTEGAGVTAAVTSLLLLAVWRFATDLVRVRTLFRGGAGEEILLAGWDPGHVAEAAGWLVARRVALVSAAAALPLAFVGLLHGQALALAALAFPLVAGAGALVATVMSALHLQKVALLTVETGASPARLEVALAPLRGRVLASRLAAAPLLYRSLAVALSPTRWRLAIPFHEAAGLALGLLFLIPWLHSGDMERFVLVSLGAALFMLWRTAARVLRTEGDLHSLRMREVLLSTGLSPRALSSGAVGAALGPGLAEALLVATGLLLLAPQVDPLVALALSNVLLAPVAGALAAGATGAGQDRSREITVVNAALPTLFGWLAGLCLYQAGLSWLVALGVEANPAFAPVVSLTVAMALQMGVSLRRLGQEPAVVGRRAALLVGVPMLVGSLASLDLIGAAELLPHQTWLGHLLPTLGVLCLGGLAAFLVGRWCFGPLALRLATSPPSPGSALLLGAVLGEAGAWAVGLAQVPWHLELVSSLMFREGPLPTNAGACYLAPLAGGLAAAVLQCRWRLAGPPLPWRPGALALRLAVTAAGLGLGLHLAATAGLPEPIAPAGAAVPATDVGESPAELQLAMQRLVEAAARMRQDDVGARIWQNRQAVLALRAEVRDLQGRVASGRVDATSTFWDVQPGSVALELWSLNMPDLGAEMLIASLALQESTLGDSPQVDLKALRHPSCWSDVQGAIASGRVSEPLALLRLVRGLPDGSSSRRRLLGTVEAERWRVVRGERSGVTQEGDVQSALWQRDLLRPPLPGPLRAALHERDRRQAGANLVLAARLMPTLLTPKGARLEGGLAHLPTPATRPLDGWGLLALARTWHQYVARVETLRATAALQLYHRDHGRYPARLEELAPTWLDSVPPPGRFDYAVREGGCSLGPGLAVTPPARPGPPPPSGSPHESGSTLRLSTGDTPAGARTSSP